MLLMLVMQAPGIETIQRGLKLYSTIHFSHDKIHFW